MATIIPRTYNFTPDYHPHIWSSSPNLHHNNNSEFNTLYCHSKSIMVEDRKRKLVEEEEEEKEVEEVEMTGKSRQSQPYSNLLCQSDPHIRLPTLATYSFIDLLSYATLSEGDEQEEIAEGGVEGESEEEQPRKRHASESAMSAISGELASLLKLVKEPHFTEPHNTPYDAVFHFGTPAKTSNSTVANWYTAGSGQSFETNLGCVVTSGGNCGHFGGTSGVSNPNILCFDSRHFSWNARDSFIYNKIQLLTASVGARLCARADWLYTITIISNLRPWPFNSTSAEHGGGATEEAITENEEQELLSSEAPVKRASKRSDAARKRRNLRSREKQRVKRSAKRVAEPKIAVTGDKRVTAASSAKPPTKNRPKKHVRPSTTSTPAPERYVEVSRTSSPLVEEDRRRILTVLAMGLTEPGPSTEKENKRPLAVDLAGVKLHHGTVRVGTSSLSDQARVLLALAALGGDYTVSEGRPARRYIIGLPGYMADLGAERAVSLLEMQNPGLPRGGLQHVSLFRGRGTGSLHPILFVDATEEAVQYLVTVNFTLRTLTSPVGVRPAAPRDSSQQ